MAPNAASRAGEIIRWLVIGIFGLGAAIVVLFFGTRILRALLAFTLNGPISRAADLLAYVFPRIPRIFNIRKPRYFKRRDLLSSYASRRACPSVIPLSDHGASIEAFLAGCGERLNTYARIHNTNLTIFRLRNWLRNCEAHHREKDGAHRICEPLVGEDDRCPLWLIDIEDCCLVPYRHTLSYVALSYVWGRVETAKTSVSNLTDLQQPGSLLGRASQVRLPRTVRDAMFLTGFLGQRYLWCDRLCIVQDDPRSKHSQVQQMAYIYARSFCTIIALDNLSADSGIHGLPTLSRLADHEKKLATVDVEKCLWPARAWTFQEELFSVRLIWLKQNNVSWQCSTMQSSSSSGGNKDYRSGRDRLLPWFNSSGDHMRVGGMYCPPTFAFHFYTALVKKYSERFMNELHPEDRFYAFSSIQKVLESTCAEGFIQGLPATWLPCALLWRSTCKAQSTKRLTAASPMASWSWIGWLMPVVFPNSRSGERHESPRGIVLWSVSEAPNSRRFPISSAADMDIEAWSLHARYEPTTCQPDAPKPVPASVVTETHDGASTCHLLGDVESNTGHSTLASRSRSRFLHGRALLAQFMVCKRDALHPGLTCLTVNNENSSFAGVLYEQNAPISHHSPITLIALSRRSFTIRHCHMRDVQPSQREIWSSPDHVIRFSCREYGPTTSLEDEYYVDPWAKSGIACCHVETTLEALYLDKRYGQGEVYEYYDAMWIEWEGGVAQRKGLARIAKDVLERETLGWIDLTLG
ncbi:hypothetical protein M409DRAFT_24356 [Zasmidium cellare ATCC 36951]|uniref:Heterokaryon incompatibility domain-containing protein n=1 Tax=Zasmidium cellare ATCC 36951 TaxID=1080233 RepID=A0A6A6CE72_ZASCE|nr:uncharacterized protein M409DRAFT_24356 [Zasmidium cellare ATCC 36951]KAF2165504.1 hypothetical protein M409DRAFT_24356 [Zasmidium cellare ATCC 36951]